MDFTPDVLVCGGGMAGCAAAIAAARNGARTLLVERYGFLGGSATAAAVGQFIGWETASGRRVIAGIAEEIVQRLLAEGAALPHGHFTMSTGHRMDRVQYDPEVLKCVLDALAIEAGVAVLLHAAPDDVAVERGSISEVTLRAKSGRLRVRPRMVIDASGELEVLAAAGAPFLALEAGAALQPATMMFRFGPIDFAVFDALDGAELAVLARRGVAEGALARAALHASRVPGGSDAWFNISRVAVDGTDPLALSAAEMEGRRQALAAARFLAASVPGCGQGRLLALAPQLGIRESRRIAGEYELTGDDLRRGLMFADAIALGAYPIDMHPAQGAGLHFETFGADHCYAIPLRSLIPRGLANALAAGRGISASHEAHAAIRVMPLAMAIGQAAGTAAALATMRNAPVRALPMAALRAALAGGGAVLPEA